MTTTRIAVVGSEAASQPLIAASERLAGIECFCGRDELDTERVDAVVYRQRRDDSARSICDLVRGGRHVLIDIATLRSTTEVDAVAAACAGAGVPLVIATPRRFLPSAQAIRQSLDSGELGQPGLLRIHRWCASQGDDLEQRLVGEIDLAIDLFGAPPTTVFAVTGDDNSPSFVQVHLGFDGGGMALLDVTTGLPEGDDYYSLSLIGSDGSAYADDHHDMQLLYRGGPVVAQRADDEALVWVEPLRRFAEAIGGAGDTTNGDASARSTFDSIAAVHRSLDAGGALHRQGGSYESA